MYDYVSNACLRVYPTCVPAVEIFKSTRKVVSPPCHVDVSWKKEVTGIAPETTFPSAAGRTKKHILTARLRTLSFSEMVE